MSERPTRRLALESAILSLIVLSSSYPYIRHLVTERVPRFSMLGDYAVIEQVTRLVWTGRVLVGPYSRFGFSHPGPLYFFVQAPIYALLGTGSHALFVGALAINLCSMGIVVASMRFVASRAHAIAAAFAMLAWVSAFGNVLLNPWNPLVIALPLVAYLVLLALFAAGHSFAAVPAAFLGALAVQTHIAADPAAILTAIGAGYAFYRSRIRRNVTISRRDWMHLGLAGTVIVAAFTPLVIEQITSPRGNMTKIFNFFFGNHRDGHPLTEAVRHWAVATSWLPNRILGASLLHEPHAIPLPMNWQPMPGTVPPSAWAAAFVHIVAAGGATFVAWKRHDKISTALLVSGLGGQLASIYAITKISGDVFPYLLFWICAFSAAAWIGILATALNVGAERVKRLGRMPNDLRFAALCGALVLGSCGAVHLQKQWIAQNDVLPSEHASLKEVYGKLADEVRLHGWQPIIHMEGAWTLATVLVLELARDGIPPYLPEVNAFMFGRAAPKQPANELHVYMKDHFNPLPLASCLALFATSGDTSMFVATTNVHECPPSDPR
jgi:hypothetical protein